MVASLSVCAASFFGDLIIMIFDDLGEVGREVGVAQPGECRQVEHCFGEARREVREPVTLEERAQRVLLGGRRGGRGVGVGGAAGGGSRVDLAENALAASLPSSEP